MRNIVIVATISILLMYSSCKKCYSCRNECGTQVSNNQIICSNQFSTDEEWRHFLDSLSTGFYIGSNGNITFNQKVCNEQDRIEYENKPGISCMPVNN